MVIVSIQKKDKISMIEFIKSIARQAGQIALDQRRRFDESLIHVKGTDTDLVTDVDRQIEKFLIDKISSRYPDHGFYGEETGVTNAGSEYRWVIDPIDGTTSYIHDFHFYSVSIGLQRNEKNIAAVVYAPKLDELFSAVKDGGAMLNDRPIHVSSRPTLRESLLGTGFACIRARLAENNLKYFARIVPEVRGIRRTGSAALDLCNVACGRFDGFWEMELNLYDIAAGVLILEEAGGLITDFKGGTDVPASGTLATNRLIHNELLKYLQD
jgi:myo-inositol-1(or 4)-monophosphatase